MLTAHTYSECLCPVCYSKVNEIVFLETSNSFAITCSKCNQLVIDKGFLYSSYYETLAASPVYRSIVYDDICNTMGKPYYLNGQKFQNLFYTSANSCDADPKV